MLPELKCEGLQKAACGQDVFIAELLHMKRSGIFFDIGANDGVTISNTYYLEKELGWNGVAVEPIPSVYEKLKSNRNCTLVKGCITPKTGTTNLVELVGAPNMLSTLEENYSGLTARRIRKNKKRHNSETRKIEVKCYSFCDVTTEYGISEIDFLSIDTEGGELEILKSINFKTTPTKVISVENNFYTNAIRTYLEQQGFIYIGTFKIDEIYLFAGNRLRKTLIER